MAICKATSLLRRYTQLTHFLQSEGTPQQTFLAQSFSRWLDRAVPLQVECPWPILYAPCKNHSMGISCSKHGMSRTAIEPAFHAMFELHLLTLCTTQQVLLPPVGK